jgi:hypothetical protein
VGAMRAAGWGGFHLGRAVVLGLTAVGMTLGPAAAPADAAIGAVSAKLAVKNLSPLDDNICQLSVDGLVVMTQTEAQGLIDSGHKVVVRVWGEDPIYDDLLLGPYYLTPINPAAVQTGHISVTPRGLAFHKHVAVHRFKLDEDPESKDEIYVGVRLVNSDGTTIRSGETPRLSAEFRFQPPCG